MNGTSLSKTADVVYLDAFEGGVRVHSPEPVMGQNLGLQLVLFQRYGLLFLLLRLQVQQFQICSLRIPETRA